MIDEENKKILEWCGLKLRKATDGHYYWFDQDNTVSPTDEDSNPVLDLNFYRKYAMPKLFRLGLDYKLFSDDGYHFCDITRYSKGKDKRVAFSVGIQDPNEAFRQALLGII